MTQEIKQKLEEAAGDYGNRRVSREAADGFEAGAQTILENPEEWDLCSLEVHKQAVKTFDKITMDAINAERSTVDERNQLQSQLTEYREALEDVDWELADEGFANSTGEGVDRARDIIKEVLKHNEQ